MSHGRADWVRPALLGYRMATRDILLSYRRSTLGPIWSTLTLALQISLVGFLFSQVFSKDFFAYLLHLSTGLVVWTFLSNTINEATNSMISSGHLIKNFKIPVSTHPIRIVVKNFILFAHNLSIVFVIWLFGGADVDLVLAWILPGLVLAMANVSWLATVFAFVSARFRDFPALIAGLMTVGFYLTPIIWTQDQVTGTFGEILFWANPFLYIFDPIRLPLVGEAPPVNRLVGAILLLVAGFFIVSFFRKRFFARIVFWV